MRSVYRPITLALALMAAAAFVPAQAGEGSDCPRANPPQPTKAAAPKAPTTAAAEPEKKEGLRRFKLEAL
ncbi:hypothetical protein [Usitatibacter palustris]|uniref:Uncharacterized protein n=1 Tax=Usitatibacter palustris TaxID=2732487 RepID=A0A6M4HA03_9PROT|nr:hypothetical protein [Usitatibacter palustris]QJR16005.1 hypothetical protein DSM104440_02833 [Usitatibacter palustris]